MRKSQNIVSRAFRFFAPSQRLRHTPPEKMKAETVIVIPIGPKCKVKFVLDTIASVMHYIPGRRGIIIADDSQSAAIVQQIKRVYPDVIILSSKRNLGKGTGLYKSLCIAYRYALDHFDFATLLRLDSDALMIGFGADEAIAAYFEKHPNVGLAGTYVSGNRSVDDFGNVWDNYGGRGIVVAIGKMVNRYFLRSPVTLWKIRRRLFKAIDLGYEFGDLVFGGAYAFSYAGLERLRAEGLLPMRNIVGTGFEEDHLFSLLIRSVNMELGDLSRNDGPFSCVWKGLPAPPEKLCEADKKIIHSTRYYKELREGDIRDFFLRKRDEEKKQIAARE